MKHFCVLLALAALFVLGSSALAEPIMRAEDSVPVSIYIAPWVWVDITGELISIDVEADTQSARGSAPLIFGANTHAHIVSSFVGVVPPGVTVDTSLENITVTSGTGTWYYFVPNSELCLNWPDVAAAGTFAGDLFVNVSGVDITDRAGLYTGTAYATIYVY